VTMGTLVRDGEWAGGDAGPPSYSPATDEVAGAELRCWSNQFIT
jgi:hypothetical protein